MTGSVAGVGQLLETVGVPVAQAGQESKVPGQDFASAMQQAGGPSSQELARVTGGQDDAENGAPGGGSTAIANATHGAQRGSTKSAGAGEANPAGQPSRRQPTAGAGSAQGAARGVVNRATVVAANVAGSKQAAVTLDNPVELSSAEEQSVPVLTGVTPRVPQPILLSGTDKSQAADAQVPVPAAAYAKEVPVASVGVATPVNNVLAGATTTKAGGAKETAAKTVGTASASADTESKLTAMVPRGTVDAAQLAPPATAMALGGSMSAATLPVVVDAASASAASGSTASTAAENTPAVAVSVLGVPAKLTVARAGGAQAASRLVDTTSEAMGTVASGPDSVKGMPPQGEFAAAMAGAVPKAAGSTVPVVAAPVEQKAGAMAGAPEIAEAVPSAASAAQVVATEASANQTVTAVLGLTDQATESARATLQKTGFVEGAAPKPVLHGDRSTAAAPKLARNTATIDGPRVAPVAAAAQASRTSAVPAQAAIAAVPVSVNHTSAAAAEENTKPKLNVSNAAAAPVQGAPATAKGTIAVEEVSPETTTTAKGIGDLGHAAAAEPTVLPAEPVAVAVASIPVSMAHEAGTGVTGASATTGVVGSASGAGTITATHETAGAAGLGHTTLSSTPTSLEVGVSSGTHGWLKIRAELNAAGEVNASLTGMSAAAAEKLRGDLPALNNYLQDEKLAIGTLDVRSAPHTTLATGEGSATFSQASSGQGSAEQQAANQNFGQTNAGGAAVGTDAGSAGGRTPQQRGGSAVPAVGGDEVVAGRGSNAAVYANLIELGDSAGPSPVGYGAGGGWLNVRA